LIHLAAGWVSNRSIDGVPAGSIVDLRTYGFGVTKSESSSDGKETSWTIGAVAKPIDLNEIDKLIDDLQQARLGLGPYMELVDKITHPPKPAAEILDGLEKRKPL
jgi:hypothetical protein